MSKYIDGLGDAMKDRKSFDALPNEIKKSVYDFLKFNRELKKLTKQFEKEKDDFEKKVGPILKSIQKAEENISKLYNKVKKIPNNFDILSGLYLEKEKSRRGYFLDIRLDIEGESKKDSKEKYGLKKRKVNLGKTLKEIEAKIKLIKKDSNPTIKYKNYKSKITNTLRKSVNDFILKNGIEKFYDDSFHIVWDEKGKFNYKKLGKISKSDSFGKKPKESKGKYNISSLGVKSSGY